MNRMRALAISLCVGGAAATLLGLGWYSDKLYSRGERGALAYQPDEAPPRVDLASVQRDWPQSLGADGARLIAYHRSMRGKTPVLPGSAQTAPAAPPPDLDTLLATADPGAGKDKIRACMSCHDFTQGGPNRIGPNLWGVVGRTVAAHAGFAYSPAMKGHGGSWSYENLYDFLGSPAREVPGTKMSFAGLRRPEDRAAVIKYLASLRSDLPMPKAATGGN
ncbi:c-type cytochrome [Sphingobium bisphenolivorans]|uniref:c-type cytochrome n=1 Tax=Sphingobium bisphenolivorans TaxID=1335760 RepID=UPI0003A60384|nr:cytochrome c family protein [Sphingobium bisphenolivorans]